MVDKVKITFIQTPKPTSIGPEDVYAVGKSYEVRTDTAEHFIRRGVAKRASEVSPEELKAVKQAQKDAEKEEEEKADK